MAVDLASLDPVSVGAISGIVLFVLAFVVWALRNRQAKRRASGAAEQAGDLAASLEPASSPRPWLSDKDWARREIVYSPQVSDVRRADGSGPVLVMQASVSTPFLVFLWLFGGAVAVGISIAVVSEIKPSSVDWPPDAEVLTRVFQLLFILGIFVGTPAGITRLWLRDRRYRSSICRLITLPGVIGGWFKADVECALPPGTGPVTVRLSNIITPVPARFPTQQLLWHMTETTTTVAHPKNARHSIVPVRLRVLRHYNQKSSVSPQSALGGESAWVLEIEKKTGGDDYFAAFGVPIYATHDAPASEQRQE